MGKLRNETDRIAHGILHRRHVYSKVEYGVESRKPGDGWPCFNKAAKWGVHRMDASAVSQDLLTVPGMAAVVAAKTEQE